ncbi:unnamed protein product, partial [Urochloa humidicola]
STDERLCNVAVLVLQNNPKRTSSAGTRRFNLTANSVIDEILHQNRLEEEPDQTTPRSSEFNWILFLVRDSLLHLPEESSTKDSSPWASSC